METSEAAGDVTGEEDLPRNSRSTEGSSFRESPGTSLEKRICPETPDLLRVLVSGSRGHLDSPWVRPGIFQLAGEECVGKKELRRGWPGRPRPAAAKREDGIRGHRCGWVQERWGVSSPSSALVLGEDLGRELLGDDRIWRIAAAVVEELGEKGGWLATTGSRVAVRRRPGKSFLGVSKDCLGGDAGRPREYGGSGMRGWRASGSVLCLSCIEDVAPYPLHRGTRFKEQGEVIFSFSGDCYLIVSSYCVQVSQLPGNYSEECCVRSLGVNGKSKKPGVYNYSSKIDNARLEAKGSTVISTFANQRRSPVTLERELRKRTSKMPDQHMIDAEEVSS
ncbi:hypothetical protein MLD38_038305 [Melastoma candidum]|uniref:Uncharacterized protein n=1 Tax=Melastoma candidum TaxID=119954 RepID=A0ACB9KZQ0_9MYRT|nr:hypothetical protein MLD38_038305 [Melastoma candidum]